MSKHIKDRVAEKLVEGKGVAEAAEELGVHRNSVSYHKKALTSIDSDSVQEYRASQLIELSELKAQLVSPNIPPVKKVELALAIIDREIDLLGTKAPTKSIQARIDADVDPEQLIGHRRFVHETRGLDQDAIESCVPIRPPAFPPRCGRTRAAAGIGTLGGGVMRLLEYIKHVKPSYEPDWFHLAIIAELEKVAAGEQSLLVLPRPWSTEDGTHLYPLPLMAREGGPRDAHHLAVEQ